MPESQSMHGIAFFSATLDIVIALIALVLLWVFLRVADWAAKQGQNKHERGDNDSLAARGAMVIARIESEPLPAAIYYTGRWVGGCIVLGMLLG
jgi:hypothetical protein